MSPVYGVKETEPGWWRITRNDVPTGDWYHREGLAQFALNELGRYW